MDFCLKDGLAAFVVGVGDRTAGSTNRSNASWADGTAS
jgi:hypothetical protein